MHASADHFLTWKNLDYLWHLDTCAWRPFDVLQQTNITFYVFAGVHSHRRICTCINKNNQVAKYWESPAEFINVPIWVWKKMNFRSKITVICCVLMKILDMPLQIFSGPENNFYDFLYLDIEAILCPATNYGYFLCFCEMCVLWELLDLLTVPHRLQG